MELSLNTQSELNYNIPVLFKCPGNENNINTDKKANFILKDGITKKSLLEFAEYEKCKYKSEFLIFPLCINSEAAAFGAEIVNNEKGIYIKQYKFSSIDEFLQISPQDIHDGFSGMVLECLKLINNEASILKITGAFSVLASLIEPFKLYKSIKKESKNLHKALTVINNWLISYAAEALKNGVCIISFADIMGSFDMLGKNAYSEFIGKYQKELFIALEQYLTSALLHICGKNSTDLECAGFIEHERLECIQPTYGKEILSRAKQSDFKICGYGCINAEDEKKQWIYRLILI